MGPLDYECGTYENLVIRDPQTDYKYQITLDEKFSGKMTGVVTETPEDVTSYWTAQLKNINNANLYHSKNNCKFCCNRLSFPGTEHVGGLYPD